MFNWKRYLSFIPIIAITGLIWFFRDDQDVINFFTGLGAFATVIYCVYTVSIVKSTQASVDLLRIQREEENRARITIVPFSWDSKINLKISNNGKLPAKDLKLTLNLPVHLIGGKHLLNDVPLVKKGVKAFQAGVNITFCLGLGHEVMKRTAAERTFIIQVSYKTGIRDQSHDEEIWIDLESWWMSDASRSQIETAQIEASKALKQIASNTLK